MAGLFLSSIFVINDTQALSAPVLPAQGAYQSGVYRNLFAEAGYSQSAINTKVTAAYNQLFHSTSTDQMTGQALLITDPTDSTRAYIWDTGDNDVRTEGMSYGMMIAVQMNDQVVFNKLWSWANHYMLNTSGAMTGYFAWHCSTSGNVLDSNPAPDGEEYFVTALFLASNRWGDGTGIFNYSAQANALLDNMYASSQTHYVNSVLVPYSLFDHTANQVVFTPAGGTPFTDPSYHLPAFYKLWSLWAAHNNAYWSQLADTSRAFWKKTVNVNTGLNPDYANFDGSIVSSASPDHQQFEYDAWRTVGNAALDYSWWAAEPWETTYANTIQTFWETQGVSSYVDLYTLNGAVYASNTAHSPGLVGENAIASLAANNVQAWDFVNALWNTSVPTGQYRYYDGMLYMLSMLAVSGNYHIYCPNNSCAAVNSSSSSATSSALSSSSMSSVLSTGSSSAISSKSSASSSSSISSSVSSSSSSTSSSKSSSSSSASGNLSAYNQIEAENYTSASSGVTKISADGGIVVNYGTNSDWISFANVDFGSAGAGNINIRSTDPSSGATIQVYLDSLTGTNIATVYPNGGGTYTTAANQVYPKPTGVHTIYIKASSANVKINWLKFLP